MFSRRNHDRIGRTMRAVNECDRQTHGQTYRLTITKTAICITSRGKNDVNTESIRYWTVLSWWRASQRRNSAAGQQVRAKVYQWVLSKYMYRPVGLQLSAMQVESRPIRTEQSLLCIAGYSQTRSRLLDLHSTAAADWIDTYRLLHAW